MIKTIKTRVVVAAWITFLAGAGAIGLSKYGQQNQRVIYVASSPGITVVTPNAVPSAAAVVAVGEPMNWGTVSEEPIDKHSAPMVTVDELGKHKAQYDGKRVIVSGAVYPEVIETADNEEPDMLHGKLFLTNHRDRFQTSQIPKDKWAYAVNVDPKPDFSADEEGLILGVFDAKTNTVKTERVNFHHVRL